MEPTELFINTLADMKKRDEQRAWDAMSPEQKIFQRIQMKKNQGYLLTKPEQEYEKKYLGVDDKKKSTKELSSSDRKRMRDMAVEVAKRETAPKNETGVIDPDSFDKYEPDEETIQKFLPRAAKFLFPNMESEFDIQADKDGEPKSPLWELDITLPENITTQSGAIEHLMEEYDMSEEEARAWLIPRLEDEE